MTIDEQYEQQYGKIKLDANAPLHYINYLKMRLASYMVIFDEIEKTIKQREQEAFKAGWYMSSQISNNNESNCDKMFEEWRNSR